MKRWCPFLSKLVTANSRYSTTDATVDWGPVNRPGGADFTWAACFTKIGPSWITWSTLLVLAQKKSGQPYFWVTIESQTVCRKGWSSYRCKGSAAAPSYWKTKKKRKDLWVAWPSLPVLFAFLERPTSMSIQPHFPSSGIAGRIRSIATDTAI